VRPLLTAEQEQELGRRVKAGDQTAVAELVERNTRLAFALAAKQRSPHFDLDERYSQALQGLWDVARYYDPEKGHRFGAYANRCIVHELSKREARAHVAKRVIRAKTFTDLDAPTRDSLAAQAVDVDLDPQPDLAGALAKLPDNLRTFLELRFGLSDGKRLTFREVGERLGCGREWARKQTLLAIEALQGLLSCLGRAESMVSTHRSKRR
jgi:RNA polymerase sigma factor (sigma-70 family)